MGSPSGEGELRVFSSKGFRIPWKDLGVARSSGGHTGRWPSSLIRDEATYGTEACGVTPADMAKLRTFPAQAVSSGSGLGPMALLGEKYAFLPGCHGRA